MDRLLERAGPLEACRMALDSASDQRSGLLAFSGQVGIGKTALLTALARRTADTGALVLSARCAKSEQKLPLGVVLQLFEDHVVGLSEAERRSLFAGRAAVAQPWVTGRGPRDLSDLAKDSESALALKHGLYRLTVNLSSQRPVILTIDDLHYADPESARFLLYLAPRLAEIDVSVVVTICDGHEADADDAVGDLIGADCARVDRLAPLARSSVGKLVARRFGACSSHAAETCHWLTGGNPMLVKELIAAAADAGLSLEEASAAEICERAPDRIRHRVLAPLASMPERALDVVRAAAVLGSASNRQLVAAMTELDGDELSDIVEQLESAGILDHSRPLEFAYPLIRAAVYSQISPEARMRLHARAAGVLRVEHPDPIRVATHLVRTQPDHQDWVVEELVRAAQDARSNGELDRAFIYLKRALAEPPKSEIEAVPLLELGRTEADRGDLDSAIGALTRATEISRERERAAATMELGRTLTLNGNARDAAAFLDREMNTNGRGTVARQRLEARWLATALIEPSLRPEARRRIAQLGAPEAERDTPALLAVVACHLALTGRSREDAIRLATAALADRLSEEPAAWAPALQTLAWCGDLEQAAEASELAAGASGKAIRGLASARLAAAHCGHLAGRLREAEGNARAALSLSGGVVGDYVDSPHARLAAILVDRGNVESAETAIQRASATLTHRDSVMRALVLGVSAMVHAAQHRHADALAEATEAGRILDRAGVENPAVCGWRSQAALAAAAMGERSRARELVAEELRLARRFGGLPALGVALGRAASIETELQAIDMLTEAEAILERSGARVEHARVLAELGACLRRRGSLRQAREILRQALDAATELGCGGIASQALSDLRLAGARPRSNTQTGTAALTAAEERVARLAASGLTNREIAEELVVTKKTVEWHLRNVFRKLDLESREELPRELEPDTRIAAPA